MQHGQGLPVASENVRSRTSAETAAAWTLRLRLFSHFSARSPASGIWRVDVVLLRHTGSRRDGEAGVCGDGSGYAHAGAGSMVIEGNKRAMMSGFESSERK